MKSKTDTAKYYAVQKGKIKIAMKMHLHLLLAAVVVYVFLVQLFFISKHAQELMLVAHTFFLAVTTGRIFDAAAISLFFDAGMLLAREFFAAAIFASPALLLYPILLLHYKRKAQKAEREEKQRLEKESRRPTVKDLF
jgi:asparagine N-glycosylation enzyme membrane subunit Stt3